MTAPAAEQVRIVDLMNPLPKQVEALDAMYSHDYVLYGGAAGPGKSYWLRWAALEYLLELAAQGHRGVRVGLFSEDYPTLRDRQISRIKREFPAWLGELRETREEGHGFHLRPAYGSGFIALRNLDDPSKYASTEFAAEFVEELTKNDRQTFDDLRFRLRWPGVAHTPFCAASNPGGIGHAWVKKLWIDGDFSGDDEAFDPSRFAFIRALPKDNPHLGEGYWKQLDSLPPNMRRALRDGDWSVFAGQAFSEWRDNLHVVEPFAIDDDWTRWIAIDYGYAAPFCALWLARSPDKASIVVYREMYATEWRAQRQAIEIRAASKGERIDALVADPSMWQRREGTSGDCLADEYKREGLDIVPANNNRIAGKGYVHEALNWKELPGNGRIMKAPRLQVFRNCRNLIRTLPALPLDDIRFEDVNSRAEDHCYDALRYGLAMERQSPATTRVGSVPIRRA